MKSAGAGMLGESALRLTRFGADSHSFEVTVAEWKQLRNELFA
jgi:hypothetical protein